MAYLPPSVTFPIPGEFLRYYDMSAKRTKVLQLADVRAPLVYPIRLGSVAPGATTGLTLLQDLNPSRQLSHRYMAFIGVRPGAYYRLKHPADFEQYQFDSRPQFQTFDMTRRISYMESPYDRPTVSIWIEPDRTPAVEAINCLSRNSSPEIMVIVAKYRVLEEPGTPGVDKANMMAPSTVDDVISGRIPSYPVYFGGDV